jgi:hypothetical protein
LHKTFSLFRDAFEPCTLQHLILLDFLLADKTPAILEEMLLESNLLKMLI